MFTVCPKCTLTLVVTTVDLRAGQGYVRCGRCANVFNALIALREGDPAAGISDTANRRLQETASSPPLNPAVGAGVADREPEPEPEPSQEPEPSLDAALDLSFEPAAEDASHDTDEALAEDGAAEDSEAVSDEASLEFDATSTDVSEIFISADEAERAGSGTFETVVLGEDTPAETDHEAPPEPVADDESHTDTIAADEWSLLDDEPKADAESVIEESPLAAAESSDEPVEFAAEEADDTMNAAQGDPPWVEEMFAEAEAEAERVRTAERAALVGEADIYAEADADADDQEAVADAARAATGAAAPSDTVLEPLLTEAAPRRPRWQLVAGVVGLALLLVAQIAHFKRQDLVLNEAVGGAVSRIYGWFGATPEPRLDLGAYTVNQLGAEAEGGEGTQLRVRLSLQNDSERVQPLPLLRLTLQDRYGNAVATRDLEPREYLPPRAADLRRLEPDQRIDAELHVIDPGKAAIGFEIDACLRSASGTIGCANDARRRAAG